MNMKMIVAVCIFLASTLTFAQTASRDRVIEMMNVLHSKDRMLQVVQLMKTEVLSVALEDAKANPKRQMNAKEIEDLRQFVEDDAFTPKMMDELLEAFIPIYQKYYTDQEINEIVAFYRSPAGQKMLTEQPKMMAEGMKLVQPLMKEMAAEMQKKAEQRAKASATTAH